MGIRVLQGIRCRATPTHSVTYMLASATTRGMAVEVARAADGFLALALGAQIWLIRSGFRFAAIDAPLDWGHAA